MIRLRACGASAGLAVCAVLLVTASSLAMNGQGQKSVQAGVYTAAQADRGQVLFRSKCASCHAPNRFTDDLFYTSFAGKPMWEMFDVISDTMPEEAPGSMKPEEYVDVMAYLLKLNNFPTGELDLPVGKEALSAIKMEKPQR
ncbi:MAG: cytochrome c [Vicinamibacterales bacterium]|jgi:mono/diheme cytochrome c family protein